MKLAETVVYCTSWLSDEKSLWVQSLRMANFVLQLFEMFLDIYPTAGMGWRIEMEPDGTLLVVVVME